RPLLHLTRAPQPRPLQTYPTPLRRPLLAAAGEPGKPAGALDAQAVAVGLDGTIARFVPGTGWVQEFALDDAGQRANPVLRAVAWPDPGWAVAVGDQGEIWEWTPAGQGRWRPEGGRPDDLTAPLTGVAFQPGTGSDRGYAVGRGGTLLAYGKTWE